MKIQNEIYSKKAVKKPWGSEYIVYDDLDILVQEAKLFGFKGILVDDF